MSQHPKDDHRPVVLIFAGHDPTGGAGIVADALTVASLGCHPATIVTAVTAQDTQNVKQFSVVETELVVAQARAILEDIPVAAIKTGMLGNTAILTAIAAICDDYPQLPLVVDPVFASGDGSPLADEAMEDAYRSLLLPRTTLLTPNSYEARALAQGADTLEACAAELLGQGCQNVLITGGHEPTVGIVNTLYRDRGNTERFESTRLPHEYHGSGCTLASACAAGLAHGASLVSAVTEALRYTRRSLEAAAKPGMGQYLPDRLYWAHDNDSNH